MKRYLGLFLFCAAVVLFVYGVQAQEENAPKLTEIQQLKAENHKLKVTLAQYESKLNECTLTTERAVLTEDFMKTLGAKPGQTFDWNTMTVQKEGK